MSIWAEPRAFEHLQHPDQIIMCYGKFMLQVPFRATEILMVYRRTSLTECMVFMCLGTPRIWLTASLLDHPTGSRKWLAQFCRTLLKPMDLSSEYTSRSEYIMYDIRTSREKILIHFKVVVQNCEVFVALLRSRQLLFEFSLAIGRLPVFPTSVGSLVPL